MHYLTILVVYILMVFSSCQKPGCFDNAGINTISVREPSPFNQIDVFNDVDVTITQDTVEKISVECGYYLQPNIVTSIQKGILTIENKTACNWLRKAEGKIIVHVSVKKLNGLNYQGSGIVRSLNTLQTDSLKIYSEQGAGIVNLSLDAKQVVTVVQHESPDIILHGKSDVAYTFIDSRGTIDFSDFKVNYMGIGYTSVRDATIYVTGGIDARIYHTGNLYLKGNPQNIVTKYYSTGRLIKQP